MGNVTGPFHIGCTTPHPEACKTCAFMQIAPDASFCAMYPDEDGEMKPNKVYFYGGKCIFWKSNKEPLWGEIAKPEDS